MRTKHWSYMGVGLIALNACVLRISLAAELGPGFLYHSPGAFFRHAFSSTFWAIPAPSLRAPVTLRLFATQKPTSLWIRNSAGLLAMDQRFKKPISISLEGQKLSICSDGVCKKTSGDIFVRAGDNGLLELKTPHHGHKWTRGELTVRNVKGRMQVINRLELEDYVGGMVEGELGSVNLSPEVMKAQIIVARTYVLAMRGQMHRHEGYDFCDGPHCQVFSGIPIHHRALEKAIQSVQGQYVSYRGRPIAAFYHHNCGGMTSAVQNVWPTHSEPYLVAVKEPAGSCQLAPHAHWRINLSKKSLTLCFRHAGWLKRGENFDGIQIKTTDASRRVEEIQILSAHPTTVSIAHFRHAVNQYYKDELLKSALFTITSSGDSFVFNGSGWGHGVGLCQEGAIWLARHGKSYKQILLHYFPNTQISNLTPHK